MSDNFKVPMPGGWAEGLLENVTMTKQEIEELLSLQTQVLDEDSEVNKSTDLSYLESFLTNTVAPTVLGSLVGFVTGYPKAGTMAGALISTAWDGLADAQKSTIKHGNQTIKDLYAIAYDLNDDETFTFEAMAYATYRPRGASEEEIAPIFTSLNY